MAFHKPGSVGRLQQVREIINGLCIFASVSWFSNLTAFMAKTDTIDFHTLDIFRAVQYCFVRTFISRANSDSQVLCN